MIGAALTLPAAIGNFFCKEVEAQGFDQDTIKGTRVPPS